MEYIVKNQSTIINIIIKWEDTNPEIAGVPVVQFQYVTFDVRRSRRLPRDRDAIVFGAALFGDDRRCARGWNILEIWHC